MNQSEQPRKWYWYSAGPKELFIDLDYVSRAINHIEARLQGAIECETLDVKDLHYFPSLKTDHAHIIIELNKSIPDVDRFVWETMFHSDIYRGCANIMRYENGVPNPDILISRRIYHRIADAVCFCPEKHTRAVMVNCPAATALRGNGRTAQFFGKPSKNPCKFLSKIRNTVTAKS